MSESREKKCLQACVLESAALPVPRPLGRLKKVDRMGFGSCPFLVSTHMLTEGEAGQK